MENAFLRLIPADVSLAEALAEYYRRNREFLAPFEPKRDPSFFLPAQQREILRQEMHSRAARSGYRFYITPAGAPETIIGAIGLSNVVWGAFRSAFLGYKLDRDYLNRGYMTMAIGMVVEYAFQTLGLHRIEANVMPRNKASLRALEKNQFVSEGLSKYYLQINGIWEDHIHMVRLNEAMHT